MCNANYAHKIFLYQIMLEHGALDYSCIFHRIKEDLLGCSNESKVCT